MTKRKGNLRRFTAFLLTAVFVFSQCFPALAAGTDGAAATLTEAIIQSDETQETVAQMAAEASAQEEIPLQEEAPLQEGTPSQKETPEQEQAAAQEQTSAQEPTAAQEAPSREEEPAQEQTSAPEEAPAQEETPAQEQTSVQEEAPAQKETSAQEDTPPQEETPAQEQTSAQEETPAQTETSAQEETPAQKETSAQEETPSQEIPSQEEILPQEGSSEAEQDKTETSEEETSQEENTESEWESGPEQESESETESESEENAEYILHLTHYFRFTADGEPQNVRIEEIRRLARTDFQDGLCDISRFACVDERLTVTEAKPVSLEDFGEGHEGGARIVYAVADGWKLEPVDGTAEDGASLRTSFEGGGVLDDYQFVPADVVRLNMKYQYSSTGGLAGIDAASPEILEVLPEKKGDQYEVKIALPVVQGFRIVLDPAPLNHYLVKEPTGNETQEELHQMWQDGSFSGDISKYCIYAYQQIKGLDAKPDYSIQNATYQNRYSDEYNEAWNRARSLTTDAYTLAAVSEPEQADGKHGANALTNPKLKVTLTEEQLENAMKNGLNITVSYRRNATWYTVKHWVPEAFAASMPGQPAGEKVTVGGTVYVLQDQEQMQGRVGGLTRAAEKVGGRYDLLVSIGFAQKLIQGEGTTVDIYYQAAESYRVIFDTDDTYIPRQQVALWGFVDFKDKTPTKKGYLFDGWKYLNKDAVPDQNGEYGEDAYTSVEKDGSGADTLQLTEELIAQKARIEEVDGVLMLHLYPIWKPDKTQITVVLWTEDLTRKDDVKADAEGGNPSYYNGKYAEYGEVKTHHFNDPGDPGASYSNMGSFTMEVATELPLVVPGDPPALQGEVQAEVTKEFGNAVGKYDGKIDISNFYTQDRFQILHETETSVEESATAAADGRTMVYVYFTRNIYTLKFHYFGTVTDNDNNKTYSCCVAYDTNGFSRSWNDSLVNNEGELEFRYEYGVNRYMHHEQEDFAEAGMPVPRTITITAKYGADLRDVWPAAREEEKLTGMIPVDVSGNYRVQIVSWATTKGKYCQDGMKDSGSSHPGESTIMGIYTTMDAEVIAAPSSPDTVHHLAAYWYYSDGLSYYRNNHCFELPGLEDPGNIEGAKTVSLYKDSTELRDTLYLVPVDTPTIKKFGFADMMEVSYDSGTGEIIYGSEGGGYYAVRGYQAKEGEEIKYYAVARRVNTVSSNRISAQNPSNRQHMTRANKNADYTSEHLDWHGQTWTGDGVTVPEKVGSIDAPYDLYFYYNRDRYSIIYKAASTVSIQDKELGRIDLPFGAYVTEDAYSFRLLYTDTNQQTLDGTQHKYLWTYPAGGPVPVCPDRNPNGTAVWKFKGWGLGPAGVNMQWTMPDEAGAQSQAAADFYIESDMLLYAIWEAPLLTVTFHLNGGTVSGWAEDTITVSVPANMGYSDVGPIPRPSRNGYTLLNWYIADESGTPVVGEGGAKTPFDFDSHIIEDLHVAAEWTTVTQERYQYTVYYVTDTLNQDDTEHTETVQIDESGSIVGADSAGNAGVKTYYVLEKAEQPEQVYVPNLVLNLTAKLQPGYTPVETNKTLAVTEHSRSYNVIFYYTPHTTGSYIVRFVKAGTETAGTPETVLKLSRTEADQTVVTPGSTASEALIQKGYQLVNRGAGGAYTPVTDYADLTWIDGEGRVHPMSTLPLGTDTSDTPETVTYLVQPIVYTVTYECAAGSPVGAQAVLDAVTAALNTPVSSAGGKNPTQYTTEDSFTLDNPGQVAVGTERYRFAFWSLGEGTTVKQAAREGSGYEMLKVDEETTGHLTFVANWEKVPTGSLTVTKTVAGAPGNRQQEFTFNVTLDDKTISGTYGDMVFAGGKASFTLKHGQEKTAEDLPEGISYKVTETPDANYDIAVTGDSGKITAGETATAAFTNTRKEAPETEPNETEPGKETEAPETKPNETEPAKETEAPETKPSETEPVTETEAPATEPNETEPVTETEASETKPNETESVTNPNETEPVTETGTPETEPSETEPITGTEAPETEPITSPNETETSETTPDPASGNSPQTGDSSNLMLWFALLLFSAFSFAGVQITKTVKKRES